MGNSYKNTSNGGGGDKFGHSPIGADHNPRPPSFKGNSYEKIREKIDRHDESSMKKGPYTKEKIANK